MFKPNLKRPNLSFQKIYMGNFNIRKKEEYPGKKYQKLESKSDVTASSSSENRHSYCFPCNQLQTQWCRDPGFDAADEMQRHRNLGLCTTKDKWEALPYVALVEIYKHLSNNDKANMGLVCKAWLLPFARPALWRRGHFRFDGSSDQRAIQFAALMGSALRHVVVDCSAPKEKVNTRAKASSLRFCVFLTNLINADNRKLETLSIRNLCRLFRYWIHQNHNDDDHISTNPVQLLTNILEKQHEMKTIDLTNAGIPTYEAVHLLEIVPNPHQVQQLSITHIVTQIERFDLIQHPRFISVITSYTGLKELRLSEEYISHNLLVALSESVNSTLRFLEINVQCKTRRHPDEGLESSWELFCSIMTQVKIAFIVKGVIAAREVRVLPSTVRLARLEWDLRNCVIDAKSFYLHLIKFKESLHCLKLSLFFAIESDVTFLGYTVQRLSNLRVLHIESPVTPPWLLYQLEACLRGCLNQEPQEDRVLKEVCINGKRLEANETWYSYFARTIKQQAYSTIMILLE